MMRGSQSENSLLLTAAAAAAVASTGYGTVASAGGPGRVNYHDSATSGEDERDGFQQPSMYQTTSSSGSRVRRSQSVDSALNRSAPQRNPMATRSSVSRSVTRAAAAAAGLSQYPHGVIYEMDSEDEEQQFLETETDLALAGTSTHKYATLPGRGKPRASASGEESDGPTESLSSKGKGGRSGVSTTGKVTKRKPTSTLPQPDTEQVKKPSRSGTTKMATGEVAQTGRGRKKPRKDSDSNDMDVE